MQLVRWLPKFLYRHKILDFICKFGWQDCVIPVTYNSNARTVIDLRDPEPRNVFIQKQFEPDFFDLANSFLGEKGTFFDLGANVGFCSFGLIPNNQRTVFHLFEANPNLIPLLRQSIELHPDQCLHLNHCCISDTHGKTNFQLEANQSGQSHVSSTPGKGIEVPNLVLDDYCHQKQITRIDFAKLDVEGHELPSLLGWKKCLSTHRVNALYVEVIPENQNRYNFTSFDLLSFVESAGYDLFLCKSDDFGFFGNRPTKREFKYGELTVSKFLAKDYPPTFATDVLAVSRNI